jgi:4-hydroxyacetophenone monooxygenase
MQRFIIGPAVPASITDDAIRAGLMDAKLGLLQIVTAQLTNEESWLSNNDRASLEEKLFSVVCDYRDTGKASPSPDCSPIFSKLVEHSGVEMADEAMGAVRKPMSKKAHDFVMDEMRGYPDEEYFDLPTAAREKFHVVICGVGVCGLAVAIRLKLAGIPFTVLEKSDSISGTWGQNIYPNVGCDTPSHMYSYSFDPNPNWEHYFAKGHENFDYFNRLADKYGVKPFVRLGHEVLSATFDETAGRWSVNYRTKDGAVGTLSANVYVSGSGQLTIPNIPDLPGHLDFQGEQFHTAR